MRRGILNHSKPERTQVLWASVLTVFVFLYSAVRFNGADLFYRVWYYLPAAALAGSFVADRFKVRLRMTCWSWGIDIAVALTCLARPIFGVPPVSGHAFFAVHALLTKRSRVTLLLALMLLGVTLYAKIVLWNWDSTLWPGLGLGVVSGIAWTVFFKRPS